MMLIGLSGFKQSGKDTVADYLVEKYGFEKQAFATPLKQAAAALFGISLATLEVLKNDDTARIRLSKRPPYLLLSSYGDSDTFLEVSPRVFLQRMGTEVGRDIFGKDFWVDQLLPMAYGRGDHGETLIGHTFLCPTVICDVRFTNELERIKTYGGINVYIERPGVVSDGHASETSPPIHLLDYAILNDGTKEDLYAKIEDILASSAT